jgi:hypothetical protein
MAIFKAIYRKRQAGSRDKGRSLPFAVCLNKPAGRYGICGI